MKSQIDAFLDKVCEQVRCREVHDELRLELAGHLEDRVGAGTAAGLPEDEAVSRAVAEMGDPVLIGRQLDAAHRPRTEWGLLGATLLWVLLGGLAMYAVDASEFFPGGTDFLAAKLRWSAVGLAVGAALFFFDYRRLHRYSRWLYAAALAGALLLTLGGPWVNGQPRGVGHLPMLFAVALAGHFAAWDWDRPWALPKALALFAAPLLIYLRLAGTVIESLQFVAVFAVLIVLTRPRPRQALILAGLGLLGSTAAAWRIWTTDYLRDRFLAVLHPLSDPLGTGFMAHQSRLIMAEAGWWGQGVGAELNRLPQVQSELIFPVLVHTFGWMAGAAIILLTAFFIGRMLHLAAQVKDRYGSFLIAAIGTLFACRFGWNLLMTLGLLPVASVELPFVSHGAQAAMQLALVGLVLSVFRRKDLGRSPLLPG